MKFITLTLIYKYNLKKNTISLSLTIDNYSSILWYFETLIYYGQTMVLYLLFNAEKNVSYNIGLWTTLAIEFWFTMEKAMVYYTKYYDTTPKSMKLWFTVKTNSVLLLKLWNFNYRHYGVIYSKLLLNYSSLLRMPTCHCYQSGVGLQWM